MKLAAAIILILIAGVCFLLQIKRSNTSTADNLFKHGRRDK